MNDFYIFRLYKDTDHDILCETLNAFAEIDIADIVPYISPDVNRYNITDPYFNQQWEMDDGGSLLFASDINLPEAWMFHRGSGSINQRIAVVDNGTWSGHPDWGVAQRLTGVFGGLFDTPIAPTDYSRSHGTRVAGVIGAKANNSLGIAGINDSAHLLCYNWEISYFYTIIGDILDREDVLPVNNSYGFISDNGTGPDIPTFNYLTQRWYAMAHDMGHLIVASRGNYGAFPNYDTLLTYPSNFGAFVLNVGGIDSSGALGGGSSRGNVDVVAPAQDIYTLTYRDTLYENSSGTSFAAPMVTGVASLLHEYALSNRGIDLTPADIQGIIKATANPPANPQEAFDFGNGKLNAYSALRAVSNYQNYFLYHQTVSNATSVVPWNGPTTFVNLFEPEVYNPTTYSGSILGWRKVIKHINFSQFGINDLSSPPYVWGYTSDGISNEGAGPYRDYFPLIGWCEVENLTSTGCDLVSYVAQLSGGNYVPLDPSDPTFSWTFSISADTQPSLPPTNLQLGGDEYLHVALSWSLPNDGEVDHYEIHRRVDSGSYELLATTENKSFVDVEFYVPTSGVTPEHIFSVSYKVRSVDFWGNPSLFSNTGSGQFADIPGTEIPNPPGKTIVQLPLTTELRALYPNPFNEKLTIEYSLSSSEQVSVIIYDALGRTVLEKTYSSQIPGLHRKNIDFRNLSTGTYFVKIFLGDYSSVKKITMIQ